MPLFLFLSYGRKLRKFHFSKKNNGFFEYKEMTPWIFQRQYISSRISATIYNPVTL